MKSVSMTEPSYLELHRLGILKERINAGIGILKSCTLCPRRCKIDRTRGETGFCRTGRKAIVSSYNSHFGEESPLVGTNGSGTIFMGSCNLLCSFCQNFEISHHMEGVEAEPENIAAMMLQLSKRGCHNINFVTPTHVIPQLLESLVIAIDHGLNIPLVYNSGGYDSKETLELLDGIFDIYMPDIKFWDNKWSREYCGVDDYRENAKISICEMHRQVGNLQLDSMGIAIRGLLVRHLVMPNNIAGSEEVFKFISEEISTNTYVNIMDQYRPCGNVMNDKFINRRLFSDEYNDALDSARKAGLIRLDSRDRIRFFIAQ